ncbi:hypothetical protein AVEN_12712-1 [Araneus ventricosus]|uniref:Uncharacterized protein n=1 Tax=Araneus ventricosus TaxID=182803 RepID=A0A4Y2ADL3_ARAVE|nr:hypothetical protein AVEN_12712-1 [Araneus ventricosus]
MKAGLAGSPNFKPRSGDEVTRATGKMYESRVGRRVPRGRPASGGSFKTLLRITVTERMEVEQCLARDVIDCRAAHRSPALAFTLCIQQRSQLPVV